jgi:uncharacterized protein YndB with AHSA1/START domain
MARNTIDVDAPPEAVFEVLSDPRLYPTWVVGASTTRDVDGCWPEPGAVLHHTQAFVINDSTSVLRSEPLRRLVLEARARPLVVAEVDIKLEPASEGTRIVLDEHPTGGILGMLPSAISDGFIHLRNRATIRRLKRLAEIGRCSDGA